MEEGTGSNLQQIIEPVLDDMGYDLVRLMLLGATDKTLQIMAERKDRNDMTVTDCAKISRNLSAILDVEDPIKDKYILEVSSPGLERPLIKLEDFKRFSGFDAKIKMHHAIDERKTFKGKILEVTPENAIKFAFEDGEVDLPFDDISKARLILTDELIKNSLKK